MPASGARIGVQILIRYLTEKSPAEKVPKLFTMGHNMPITALYNVLLLRRQA
jgi:hypothetical protein